ncbi:hypothetical protein GCM10023096_06780 [Nonomuraea ferruginea]
MRAGCVAEGWGAPGRQPGGEAEDAPGSWRFPGVAEGLVDRAKGMRDEGAGTPPAGVFR